MSLPKKGAAPCTRKPQKREPGPSKKTQHSLPPGPVSKRANRQTPKSDSPSRPEQTEIQVTDKPQRQVRRNSVEIRKTSQEKEQRKGRRRACKRQTTAAQLPWMKTHPSGGENSVLCAGGNIISREIYSANNNSKE